VTELLEIPTIGIGAGADVNGQVLVYQDMIGLNPSFMPKFLRTYANTFESIQIALNAYDRDVKDGKFPSESESYHESFAGAEIVQNRTRVSERKYRLTTGKIQPLTKAG
jgi:ketopantoate hydroxymethyltransferase